MKSHVVYRYLDAAGRVLYVGRTCNYPSRRRTHAEKAWWPYFAREIVRDCGGKSSAVVTERMLIQQHKPVHNKTHNTGKLSLSPKFSDYVSRMNASERSGFCALAGFSDAYLTQLISGHRPIGIESAVKIIVATEGQFVLEDLRPDLFEKARQIAQATA